MTETVERDFRGHYICAGWCRFFRTTDVNGRWRVSTVGDMHFPPEARLALGRTSDGPEEIGFGRTYETMVFPLGDEVCGCGCGANKVSSWAELESRGYTSEADAVAGHAELVEKWSQD